VLKVLKQLFYEKELSESIDERYLYSYRYIPWEKDIKLENALRDNVSIVIKQYLDGN
jgi:hypothetical protein